MFRRNPKSIPGLVRILILAAIVGICGCGNKSYISVNYRLPDSAGALTGRTVFIETQDLRSDTEIFNTAAKEKFKNFTGLFSLSVVTDSGEGTVAGAYPLPLLFETAMKKRLNRLGVETATRPTDDIPVFQIKINTFHINLVGQKWQADISYEANLAQDTQLVARERVTGNAERMKVIGTGGAEKIIGEIFTDLVNRLNIERLFQQAKL